MSRDLLSADSLAVVEFAEIIDELVSYCLTEGGMHYTRALPVHVSREKIEKECQLVSEWRTLLEIPEILAGLTFPTITDIIGRLDRRALFSAKECAALMIFLRNGRLLAQRIVAHNSDSSLATRYTNLPHLHKLETIIERIIDDSGRVRIEAVPELQSSRNQADQILKNAQDTAHNIMRHHHHWWSNDQPSIHNGRIVLPLKADFNKQLSGIQHHESDSGATLYIEPSELISINNRWISAEAQYQRKLTQVLSALSSSIYEWKGTIMHFQNSLYYLDSIYARACYSRQHHCCAPQSSDTHSLNLVQARHPLIGKKVVPIDVMVAAPDSALVICGPNAGGKTVALKTIALMIYMYQCGMEIPAERGSSIPITDAIFLVIGDRQSIHSTHSTFSAQMELVAQLLKRATARSIILLDEVGANTDPAEGAALAQAIIEECRRRNALIFATTHLQALKEYALTTPGIKIAAMEFDSTALRPTYRIFNGRVENSYAHLLARRAGLPESTIEEAQRYVSNDERERNARLTKIVSAEREAAQLIQEIAKEKNELRERQAALNERAATLIGERVSQLDKLIKEARQLIEKLTALHSEEQRKVELPKDRVHIQHISAELQHHAKELRNILNESDLDGTFSHRFKVGDKVRIKQNGMLATILAHSSDNKWELQCNAIRITLAASQIEPSSNLNNQDVPYGAASHNEVHLQKPRASTSRLQDIRGLRIIEVEPALYHHIDDMCCLGYNECEILHGVGSGAVRAEVKRLLAAHPQVSHWQPAPPERGGTGRTIVFLRQS